MENPTPEFFWPNGIPFAFIAGMALGYVFWGQIKAVWNGLTSFLKFVVSIRSISLSIAPGEKYAKSITGLVIALLLLLCYSIMGGWCYFLLTQNGPVSVHSFVFYGALVLFSLAGIKALRLEGFKDGVNPLFYALMHTLVFAIAVSSAMMEASLSPRLTTLFIAPLRAMIVEFLFLFCINTFKVEFKTSYAARQNGMAAAPA